MSIIQILKSPVLLDLFESHLSVALSLASPSRLSIMSRSKTARGMFIDQAAARFSAELDLVAA